jgi:ATP-dependent Clp protease ATP-binding subunit ClpA
MKLQKLTGSPPGYLGHRETHPVLTQETLDQWHTASLKLSLVLFDEIEKASDALWQLLLGILDKGTLTLGDNRRVDLSRCIIIMTSNLGALAKCPVCYREASASLRKPRPLRHALTRRWTELRWKRQHARLPRSS